MEQVVSMVVSPQALRVIGGLLVLTTVGALIGALSRGFVRPLLTAGLIIGACLVASTCTPGLWQATIRTARNAWNNVAAVLQTTPTGSAAGNRNDPGGPRLSLIRNPNADKAEGQGSHK